ncbi:hypothetical protein CCH79_00006785 [Gambusia affinis]|uniref:Uncharacterized protein n=1 Tax=Gambusia affinis TaxID=33528 RepID=A0A315V926_GAMAF|nr:hypothetical protein CCH79_00006785 [Gambusia affinis]
MTSFVFQTFVLRKGNLPLHLRREIQKNNRRTQVTICFPPSCLPFLNSLDLTTIHMNRRDEARMGGNFHVFVSLCI